MLLFLAGLAAGMLVARNRWPPYAELDRLHDRYLVERAEFGPTPRTLLDTDPRTLIAFRSADDVDRRRGELVRFLWGGDALPAGPPQTIERGYRDERFEGLPNLARVDRLTTRLDFGLRSIGYHYLPRRGNGAAIIYHHGHTVAGARDQARIGRLLGEGYAVVELFMLLYPPNNRPRVELPRVGWFHLTQHEHLALLAPAAGHPIGYLVEPAIRAVNHLEPRYRRIAIMGYSGGGWTAMMVGAADRRVRSSFIVASVYPYFLMSGSHRVEHFEGFEPALYRLATQLELMAMAGSGDGRQALQILNRFDPCCYGGRRAETYAPAVRAAVRALGPGDFTVMLDERAREHDISDAGMDLIMARLARMR